MKSIDNIFDSFLEDLNYIKAFVEERFGNKDILLRKNSNVFPASRHDVKNTRIKGYSFHGHGCLFQFKDYYIDIEFDNDRIGFSPFTFLKYAKSRNPQLTDLQLNEFLDSLITNSVLHQGRDILMPKKLY